MENSNAPDMTILRTPDKMFDFKKGKVFYPPLGKAITYREKFIETLKGKAASVNMPLEKLLGYNLLLPHLVAYKHHASRKAAVERGEAHFEKPKGSDMTYDEMLKSCERATKYLEKFVSVSFMHHLKVEAQFEFDCQVIDFLLREDGFSCSGMWQVDVEDDLKLQGVIKTVDEVLKSKYPDMDIDNLGNKVIHVVKINQEKYPLDGLNETEGSDVSEQLPEQDSD